MTEKNELVDLIVAALESLDKKRSRESVIETAYLKTLCRLRQRNEDPRDFDKIHLDVLAHWLWAIEDQQLERDAWEMVDALG